MLLKIQELLTKWILHHTPIYITSALIVFIGVSIAKNDLQSIGRFYSWTICCLCFMVLMYLLVYRDIDLSYVKPVGQSGIWNILKGADVSFFSFLGFEIILILYSLTEGESKEKLKMAFFANGVVTLIYAFLVFTQLIYLSPKKILLINDPSFFMLRSASIGIINRVDMLFIVVWLIAGVTTYTSLLYLSSRGIEELVSNSKHKYMIMILGLTTWIVSFGEYWIMKFNQIDHLLIAFFIVFLPLFILFISKIKRNKLKE